METNPPKDDALDKFNRRIAALEHALGEATTQNQTLRTENHDLHRDYATLRLHKGGFGFKSLLFTGMMGTLVGLMLAAAYLFFRPKDAHVAAFEHFQYEHQFNIELAISQGNFDQAEHLLKESLEKPENQSIKPEIEFSRKIVGAARRRCK